MKARAMGHQPGGIPVTAAITKVADDDQCPCGGDGLPIGGKMYRCQDCGRTFAEGGIDATGGWVPSPGEIAAFEAALSAATAKKDKVGEPVDLTPEQRERFKGTSVKKDDDGYYCHTHRARSKSYPSVDAIHQSKVDFIESTGARTAQARPARLYHYTSTMHLPAILQSGHLRLTESNIEMSGAGPRVVWFTDGPSAEGIGVTPGFKDAVEIVIDTPADAAWWPEWSRQHGIEEFWYEALADAAGGSPDHWWVVPHEIPVSDFLSVKVNGKPIKIAAEGATKTAAADSTGVMVCLIPDPAATQAIMAASGSDEDPDEQHITLAYLGSTDEAGGDVGRERLHRAVYDFSLTSGHDMLHGTANGWGVFQNPDESVLVALWDIPRIAEFRAALMAKLAEHGVPLRTEDHGFTPHQTQSYADHPITALPGPITPQPTSTFSHVVISWGDEWSSIALESALAATQQQVAATLKTALQPGSRWDESKHPRGGHPENPGQFSSGPGGTTTKAPAANPVPRSKRPNRSRSGDQPTSAPATPTKRLKGYENTPDDVYQHMIARGDLFAGADHPEHFIPAGEFPKGDPRNDPEYKARDAKVAGLINRYLAPSAEDRAAGIGGATDELYDKRHDPVTGSNNLWDPAREREHSAIIDRFLSEHTKGVPREGKCLIMAGPSGAGKSTFLKQQGHALGVQLDAKGDPVNYVTVNPDDFKEDVRLDMKRYPGLSENETAQIKHEESSALAKRATEALMRHGYNVIMDVTLGNADSAISKYITAPYAKGYDQYQVALVDGDMANSRQNAGNRYKVTDKHTGERTWSGRYIPMSLVESQAPTQPGYRSINAEQFIKFAQRPEIDRAVVYDPYAPQKGLQEAKAAIREAIRRNPMLAGILRAEGGPLHVPDDADTTEITTRIRDLIGGRITEQQLVDYLTSVKYKPVQQCPYPKGSTQWYRWHEDGRQYVPGSFDEVRAARDAGLLPESTYRKVAETLWARSVPIGEETD